jgi:lipopolysaccharide transport system ATP-binding protein
MADVAHEGRTVLFVSHNMQLARRLCRRAILLDGGEVQADGDVESVVRQYLSSIETADDGRRTWYEEPLGDDFFRLYEARVTDGNDEPQTTYFSSKPVYVTLEFDLEELDPSLNIGIDVATVDGVVVFYSSVRDVAEHAAPRLVKGRNALRCEIPAELMNSGRYVINLRISLHTIRWLVYADAVLHFDVLADHGETLWELGVGRAGVVAPSITWSAVESGASAGARPMRASG